MSDTCRMGMRRQAREAALQALFQLEFTKDLSAEVAVKLIAENFEMDPEAKDYSLKLIQGVLSNSLEITNTLEAHSTHWKVDRMAMVDRNILKIATFELKFLSQEVPPHVVINEAIDIAKRFGTQDSGSFVNAVLDNICKHLSQ